MGRVPYYEFVGARTRFQRLSDQTVFSGWLQSLRNDIVFVTAEDPLPIHADDRFLFQVQGPTADAYFIATSTGVPAIGTPCVQGATARQVVELPALDYDFRLITQIQMRDAQQQARKLVATMVARMATRGRNSELLITDASSGGMGVIVWDELDKGDVIRVEIKLENFAAAFNCEVRHCRPEPKLIGAFRVGLQFQQADRLSLVAWRKMINPL
ncbi:MAG TPA: PilZ domain-containing protein [Fimbriimonadaceae bacterium]|nr:PilZ domain-containing protein [Fimbriimonadaceae bacterium]